MNEVEKDVAVAKAVKPKFLSLVGAPANQVAFKVIRDDNGEKVMAAPHIQRTRKARRSDQIVALEFDVSMSDEDIAAALKDWGVSDYTIEDKENARVVRCADAGEVETVKIRMDSGTTVEILKPISNSTQRDGKGQIAVARMEFDVDYFPSLDDIHEWCRSHSVDFLDLRPQNEAEHVVVSRGVEVGKDEEAHKIQVDHGVRFVVVRAEEADVPEAFVAVVNDAAYGNWGWGQLDFAAALADVEFSEVAGEALSVLHRVVNEILFWSELPVDVKKSLISRAASQFTDFISALMDALPARVVIANRSDLQKENSMSKQTKPQGEDTTRQDAAAAAAAENHQTGDETASTDETQAAAAEGADAGNNAEGGAGEATISRAEVEKMLGGLSEKLDALTAKLDAGTAPAQRNDAAGAEAQSNGEGGEPADEVNAATILRSISDLTEAVKGVNDRVLNLEGSTTVRTDADDGEQVQRKDVFKGMFGSRKAD